MSKTQLIALPSSEEEGVVIDRFVAASQEIVPTLQVSLAKRIVRPGSNKVLCLAAHTSVPLDDDEVASVSDLALRLSDGTNVVLSLSSFNDTVADCIPLTRSIYNPTRYAIKGESRLAPLCIAIVLLLLAGYYSMAKGPFSTIIPAGRPARPTIKANAEKHNQPLRKTPSPRRAPLSPSPTPATAGSPSARPAARARSTAAKARSTPTKANTTGQVTKDRMMVPPPPPYAAVLSPYFQWPMPVPAPAVMTVVPRSAPEPKRQPDSGNSRLTAPVPGDNMQQVQLERLVLPDGAY